MMKQNHNKLADRLIAHRGEPNNYPENSLEGFKMALENGSKYVETDIQITCDNIAILSHDPSLTKITGHDLLISQTSYTKIKNLPASHSANFGDIFSDYKIATLEMFCNLIAQYPKVTCFIEIKEDCIKSHGNKAFDIIFPLLEKIKNQLVIISFKENILKYVRQICNFPIGWVLPEWNRENKKKAKQLRAEYIFCNYKHLPLDKKELWQGPWLWVIYTLNTINDIKKYDAFGIDLFESDQLRWHLQQLTNK